MVPYEDEDAFELAKTEELVNRTSVSDLAALIAQQRQCAATAQNKSVPDSASHETLVRITLWAMGCQLRSVLSFPIVLSLPSMLSPIPPLMIFIPTTLPFGIQISPPVIGYAAVLTPVVDRFVQSCFRLFDCMLAPISVIGLHEGCCHK
jgi:hypothetical protein